VIVLDTSALMAIHLHESERPAFRTAVTSASGAILPASGYVEFVLATKARPSSRAWLDRLMRLKLFRMEPISTAMALLAADAAERYGRGSGHAARLNFGDCLSYAVAKHLGAPLLYKGDDFRHTDIESALAP
jgi:ribonuclease VapC